MIIGITGAFGSGKSTAADFLTTKGYEKITLASILEEELTKRGEKNITRKMLQDLGNEWREQYGAGILIQKALEEAEKSGKERIIIDGIRNIGEIEEIRKNKKSTVLAVLSDRKVRFERLRHLKRREELTWEIFEQLDSRDLGIGEKSTGLQVAFCIALADVFVTNNSNMVEFKKDLLYFLEGLK